MEKPRTTPSLLKRKAPPSTDSLSQVVEAVASGGAAGALEGDPDWAYHCRRLQQENADLRQRLALMENQLKSTRGNPSEAGPSTAKKLATEVVALPLLEYSLEQHTNFLRTARRVQAIKSLDISNLTRTTSSYAGSANRYAFAILFGGPSAQPKWRPDKKVDAVLAALTAGTDKVEHLDLGDAEWATEFKYAKELVKLLRKYKKNLTGLRITRRALVQRSSDGGSQASALDIISAMPCLTNLELVVTSVDNHYNVYAGEFKRQREAFGNKRPKTTFAKLKEIELYLTRDWFDTQFGDVDGCCSGDDYYECFDSVGGGGGREEYEDDQVPDLLEHRKDAITHLDMVDFRKTRVHLPITDMFAELTKLRSIVLRVEFLDIVKKMSALESMKLHVSGRSSDLTSASQAVSSVSPVLAKLAELELVVGPAAPSAALAATASSSSSTTSLSDAVDSLLGSVVEACSGLRALRLTGAGWRDAAVASALRSAAPLETVSLAQCGGVTDRHIPLVTSMPKIKELVLPNRLKTATLPPELTCKPHLKVVWE